MQVLLQSFNLEARGYTPGEYLIAMHSEIVFYIKNIDKKLIECKAFLKIF